MTNKTIRMLKNTYTHKIGDIISIKKTDNFNIFYMVTEFGKENLHYIPKSLEGEIFEYMDKTENLSGEKEA